MNLESLQYSIKKHLGIVIGITACLLIIIFIIILKHGPDEEIPVDPEVAAPNEVQQGTMGVLTDGTEIPDEYMEKMFTCVQLDIVGPWAAETRNKQYKIYLDNSSHTYSKWEILVDKNGGLYEQQVEDFYVYSGTEHELLTYPSDLSKCGAGRAITLSEDFWRVDRLQDGFCWLYNMTQNDYELVYTSIQYDSVEAFLTKGSKNYRAIFTNEFIVLAEYIGEMPNKTINVEERNGEQ